MSGKKNHPQLWHMADKMVMDMTENITISKFQLIYMYFPNMKLNNMF